VNGLNAPKCIKQLKKRNTYAYTPCEYANSVKYNLSKQLFIAYLRQNYPLPCTITKPDVIHS